MTDTNLTDTLRQKLDELELDRRLTAAARAAEQAMVAVLDAITDYAQEHRDDLDRWLDKAGATVDDKTDGRYAAQVAEVKKQVRRGVDTLTVRR
ncbi:antitoxin [Nocardioides sp.]|uniref:antitoxin n=1 Tax=Nocardioides sp. TaxID=35761 RepID=UPI00352766F2